MSFQEHATTITYTFFIALIVVSIALLGMAIGWLIGGERKILKACCGKKPDEKDSSCETSSACCMKQNASQQKLDIEESPTKK